jgi:hypothetical protein
MFWIILLICLSGVFVSIKFNDRDWSFYVFIASSLCISLSMLLSLERVPSKEEIGELREDMRIITLAKDKMKEDKYWKAHVEKQNEIDKMVKKRSKGIRRHNFWLVLPWNW